MGVLEDRDLTTVPTIPQFYKGKSVFITGGSGFMGKVLVEKLLYSCTELERIYLLLRSKRGVSPDERLEKMYSMPCFDRLRKEKPGVFESKVSVLAGDVSVPGLGLSKEDRALIVQRANIVFHVAASVRFDDPLPQAAAMNIRSAIEILEICKEIKKLDVLVHVSTAFANTQWDPVAEAMYPPYADWRDTLKVCDSVHQRDLSIFTPKYMGEIPNTYIFTKQLAEHVVCEHRGKLPIVITRPSMVIASVSEPVPGWIENFNGPVGIVAGVGMGILRTLHSRPDFSPDYVPVDACIRHFIAASWIRGTKKLEPSDDIEIYNCCSKKKITNQQLLDYGQELCPEVPLGNAMWTVNCTITDSKPLYYFLLFFTHILPALLVDSLRLLSGKKPMLLKIQRRIYLGGVVVQKFLLCEWDFKVDNFNKLRSCLKDDDLREFYYDFKHFVTKDHFLSCIWGGRRYLMKDKDENLEKSKAHIKKINMMDKILRYSVYFFVFWTAVNSNFVSNMYHKLLYH